jgi:hypothetical protein
VAKNVFRFNYLFISFLFCDKKEKKRNQRKEKESYFEQPLVAKRLVANAQILLAICIR